MLTFKQFIAEAINEAKKSFPYTHKHIEKHINDAFKSARDPVDDSTPLMHHEVVDLHKSHLKGKVHSTHAKKIAKYVAAHTSDTADDHPPFPDEVKHWVKNNIK